MATPFFDDDLLNFGEENDGASAGADDDLEDQTGSVGGSHESVQTMSAGPQRRKRGSRGGSGPGSQGGSGPKWRSGAVPQAPGFDGDVEKDPFCFRLYQRRLLRWVAITREFLPANEQALRALEQIRGDAELEFEEVDDSRFNKPDGIQILLSDLKAAFGEKELFRQGGVIREFESVGRLQGESVTAFVRRFRLLERKLSKNKVPEYPEAARVVKLLDGLRLGEQATSSLLLAAGNKYEMQGILDAIKIQFPAGMSITGLPRGRPDLRRGRGGSTTGRSSLSAASTRSTATSSKRWRQWHTSWDDEGPEDWQPEDWEDEGDAVDDEANDEDAAFEHEAEDGNLGDQDDGNADEQDDGDGNEEDDGDYDTLLAAAQSLTVTSKKLANLVQARGFYNVEGKGKSGGKQLGKGKGKHGQKGKGKGFAGKGSGKQLGKSKGKGKSQGKTRSKSDSHVQQQRLQGSLCLGCGSSDHWLRDCPHYNVQNAQLASASWEGLTLDAEGAVSSWMTSSLETVPDLSVMEKQPELFELPPLSDFEAKITRSPSVMLQYHDGYSSAYLIADTGCQRQVAGQAWHAQKSHEVQPLSCQKFPDTCRFSFGPSAALQSQGRYMYPAGIAGVPLALCVSSVDAKAPGLMSRRAFEYLGAVPDVHTGRIHFRALKRSSQLWLSPCGHLAVRIDEWPEGEFSWPVAVPAGLPDVVHHAAFDAPSNLEKICDPPRPPPHAYSCMVGSMAGLPGEAVRLRGEGQLRHQPGRPRGL